MWIQSILYTSGGLCCALCCHNTSTPPVSFSSVKQGKDPVATRYKILPLLASSWTSLKHVHCDMSCLLHSRPGKKAVVLSGTKKDSSCYTLATQYFHCRRNLLQCVGVKTITDWENALRGRNFEQTDDGSFGDHQHQHQRCNIIIFFKCAHRTQTTSTNRSKR